MAVAHGLGQLREGWGADGAATIWDTTNKIIMPGVTDSALPGRGVRRLRHRGRHRGGAPGPGPGRPARVRAAPSPPPGPDPGGGPGPRGGQDPPGLGQAGGPASGSGRPAGPGRGPGRGLGHRDPGAGLGHHGAGPYRPCWPVPGGLPRPGCPADQDGRTPPRDRHTGHHARGEDPAAEARRLQEELERARQAGSSIPYETLAALAARLSDLGAKVRHLDAVVDRSGLVMAKDIRVRVGRLTAEVDAIGARLQEVEDQVAELASKGARVPAPNWSAMDRVHPRSRAGRLSEWVAQVLVPSQAWPRGKELRPCWRAHWPVIWELGVVWAEWRRVYGREAPELAGALELEGRWLPGALDRVHRALADCRPHECILTAMTARRPHISTSQSHTGPPRPNLGPGVLPCRRRPALHSVQRPRVWRWSRWPRPRTESGQRRMRRRVPAYALIRAMVTRDQDAALLVVQQAADAGSLDLLAFNMAKVAADALLASEGYDLAKVLWPPWTTGPSWPPTACPALSAPGTLRHDRAAARQRG